MNRWMPEALLGIVVLAAVLLSANLGMAQTSSTPPVTSTPSSTSAFDRLSPGNQKIAKALFEAQGSNPAGTKSLTLDQIAAKKQSGQGWGEVFKTMKSQGLVTQKNLGQVVSSYNHRHRASSTSTVTTANNRTESVHTKAGAVSPLRRSRGDDHEDGALAGAADNDGRRHAIDQGRSSDTAASSSATRGGGNARSHGNRGGGVGHVK